MRMERTAVALVFTMSGCATNSADFYKDPSKANVTSLCRVLAKPNDPQYQADVRLELERRKVTYEDCTRKIRQENAAIAGVAIVATAAAVAIAADKGAFSGGGGGGYYAPSYDAAWDQFFDANYNLVWRCRDRATGQFVTDNNCALKAQIDSTWPSKSAYL